MDIEFKISKNPVNYKKALMFLEKRVELVKQGGKELVWRLEHPLTYSAGIRSKKEEIILKMNLVSKDEIDILNQRIEKLEKKIDEKKIKKKSKRVKK